jgi:hypothetical protein
MILSKMTPRYVYRFDVQVPQTAKAAPKTEGGPGNLDEGDRSPQ